jgi:hypothetical protein
MQGLRQYMEDAVSNFAVLCTVLGMFYTYFFDRLASNCGEILSLIFALVVFRVQLS